jgi:hypothetical protein
VIFCQKNCIENRQPTTDNRQQTTKKCTVYRNSTLEINRIKKTRYNDRGFHLVRNYNSHLAIQFWHPSVPEIFTNKSYREQIIRSIFVIRGKKIKGVAIA